MGRESLGLAKACNPLVSYAKKKFYFSLQSNGEAAATLPQAKNYSNCFRLASRCFGTLRTAAKAVTKKGYQMEITRKRVRTGNKRHQSKAKYWRHNTGGRMNTRAAQAAERSCQAVATVELVCRAKKPRR